MLALMGGMHQISIGVAIIRDGVSQSFRQLKVTSLAASQKLNGTSHHHHRQSLNKTPYHSYSALMRSTNTLYQGETRRRLHVTVIYAQHLAKMVSKTYGSQVIQIKILPVVVMQICQVLSCDQLKNMDLRNFLLLLMVLRATFNPNNLKYLEYS